MLMHPIHIKQSDECFYFEGEVHASAHPCLCNDVFVDFFYGFSYRCAMLDVSPVDSCQFRIGNAEPLSLNGFAYSIHVTKEGICIHAENSRDLIHGFMTLLDRIQIEDHNGKTVLKIRGCQIHDAPAIQNRMVHFCVFPQTKLWEMQRYIRMCGALKYTHIVLEFWGTLRFDCMKELAWPDAFTKDQVRPLIQEANALGMEVIPMFNHWGHAASSRMCHGKHVVLDQNPALQTYFTPDGWCWDISKPQVRALHREIRKELIELCGKGSYFHIGCDEANNFVFTQENMDFVCSFINEIDEEMHSLGRETIAWGDMFLYAYEHYNKDNRYYCNAPTAEIAEYMLAQLNKSVVIADWQYHATKAPVETAAVFTQHGFKCILCPWDRSIDELRSCINTAKEQRLCGIMHTTWHTLSSGTSYITTAGVESYQNVAATSEEALSYSAERYYPQTAALLRKVYPVCGDYEKAGWAPYDIGVIC